MMLKQEERHRENRSTIQRYEFHFTSIQRTSRFTYFAVRKTTQHKLPQLKLGPTIYAIGPPVDVLSKCFTFVFFSLNDIQCAESLISAVLELGPAAREGEFACREHQKPLQILQILPCQCIFFIYS